MNLSHLGRVAAVVAVICWSTGNIIVARLDLSGIEKWLMVEHNERGWELPGGKLDKNEDCDDAILREIYEESGIVGYIRNKPKKYLTGLVYSIGVKNDSNHNKIEDLKINNAKWFSSPPDNLAWGVEELKEIAKMFYQNNPECSNI